MKTWYPPCISTLSHWSFSQLVKISPWEHIYWGRNSTDLDTLITGGGTWAANLQWPEAVFFFDIDFLFLYLSGDISQRDLMNIIFGLHLFDAWPSDLHSGFFFFFCFLIIMYCIPKSIKRRMKKLLCLTFQDWWSNVIYKYLYFPERMPFYFDI